MATQLEMLNGRKAISEHIGVAEVTESGGKLHVKMNKKGQYGINADLLTIIDLETDFRIFKVKFDDNMLVLEEDDDL